MEDVYSQFALVWLGLIEKLVNPQCILESTYQYYETNGTLGFNASQYLAVTHKMAFDEIVANWSRLTNINGRVSDLTLNLMCHIIRSESVAKKEGITEKEKEIEKREEARSLADQINASHLQQLIDMGFTREAAIEALITTPNVDQAAEYLLTMSLRNPRGSTQADEEDQLRQAIALSLGGHSQESDIIQSSTNPLSLSIDQPKVTSCDPIGFPIVSEIILPLDKAEALSMDDLKNFFDNKLLACWLALIDKSPELVYRVADLLSVAIRKSSTIWTIDFLNKFCTELKTSPQALISICEKENLSNEEKVREITYSTEAHGLSIRLHLLCLLTEEFKRPCSTLLSKTNTLESLVELLSKCSHIFQPVWPNIVDMRTPKWIAPLLLCLDSYERECATLKHRLDIERLDRITWKYWDNRNWSNFTLQINKQITDAFKAGNRIFKFVNNRRRYMIDFILMVQVNLDSGYQRPIIFVPTTKELESTEQDLSTTTVDDGGSV
uniref:UBA domain-containing protein n=1 Tax=Romanomermis culicivorax TaxID=13658 RepID=A0A915HR54_ROMCU